MTSHRTAPCRVGWAATSVGLRDMLVAGLDLLVPRPCPGCGDPAPWCPRCAAALSGPAQRVPWPLTIDVEPDPQPTSSPGPARLPGLRPGPPEVWALARYSDPVRPAILAGKEHGRRDLPGRLGQALGLAIGRLIRASALPTPLWLVPAPSRRTTARRRGGDPVTLMARRAAAVAVAATDQPCGIAPCLFTDWRAADSVGLDARERADNLRRRVRWSAGAAPPSGADVLIVDDVFTTGATIACAADVLRHRGLAVRGALVVASAVPFDHAAGARYRRAAAPDA